MKMVHECTDNAIKFCDELELQGFRDLLVVGNLESPSTGRLKEKVVFQCFLRQRHCCENEY